MFIDRRLASFKLVIVFVLFNIVVNLGGETASADPYIYDHYEGSYEPKKLWFDVNLKIGEYIEADALKRLAPLPRQYRWRRVGDYSAVLEANPLYLQLGEAVPTRVRTSFSVIFNVADSTDRGRYEFVVEARRQLAELDSVAMQNSALSFSVLSQKIMGEDAMKKLSELGLNVERSVLSDKNNFSLLNDHMVSTVFKPKLDKALRQVTRMEHAMPSKRVRNARRTAKTNRPRIR